MTTYRILAPHFVAGVVADDDIIIQAAPIVGWSVGNSFTDFRDYCQKRGWLIEPLDDSSHPRWLEYEGRAYEIVWRDNAIVRITLHDEGEERDLRVDELPDVLKRLI